MKRIEFPAKVKDQAAQRANGKCQRCGLPFGGKKIHFDHILPLALGGESTLANCAVLCEPCHGEKTSREDVPRIRKADRQRRSHLRIKTKAGPKIQSPGFSKKERRKKASLPPRPLFEDIKPKGRSK